MMEGRLAGGNVRTAVARAYRWRRRFECDAYPSISDLSAVEGVDRSRVVLMTQNRQSNDR